MAAQGQPSTPPEALEKSDLDGRQFAGNRIMLKPIMTGFYVPLPRMVAAE
jgi:hypothetical protein